MLEGLAALGQDVEGEAAMVVYHELDRQLDAGSGLGWVYEGPPRQGPPVVGALVEGAPAG